MKNSLISTISVCLLLVLLACQPEAPKEDNGWVTRFENNSKIVQTVLEGWANEDLDYRSYYADDFQTWPTAVGATDTLSLDQVIANDQQNWDNYDFEMVNPPFNFLPGVDVESKRPDGSVRYYGTWKVTKPATDSTAEKSGMIAIYSAFVFDEDGKINLQLTYGDFNGIMTYVNSGM